MSKDESAQNLTWKAMDKKGAQEITKKQKRGKMVVPVVYEQWIFRRHWDVTKKQQRGKPAVPVYL